AGRGGDNQAIGPELRHCLAVKLHGEVAHARDLTLRDNDIVQGVVLGMEGAVALEPGAQHGALFDHVTVAAPAFQGGVELRQPHLGKESERAEIHAEQRYARRGKDPADRQQRAVPAQDNHQFGSVLRQVGARDGRRIRGVARALLIEHRLVAAIVKPGMRSGRSRKSSSFCGLETIAMGGMRNQCKAAEQAGSEPDHALAIYGNRSGLCAYRRNSWFPSAPAIGDGITPTFCQPSETTAAETLSTASRCAAGSRTMPPLPMCSRPASNCGLTRMMASRSSGAAANTGSSSNVAEMKETSITRSEAWESSAPGSRRRALVRSRRWTRESLRSFMAIWPKPVSTQVTQAAPR